MEPLAFDGANLSFGRGRSLDLTWTAPLSAGAALIQAIVVLKTSVEGPRIECAFPDTGAASVPTALLDRLLDLGITGPPTLYLARRTVVSTNIAPGCVELEVSAMISRSLSIDGVALCGQNGCPPPMTCQWNSVCG